MTLLVWSSTLNLTYTRPNRITNNTPKNATISPRLHSLFISIHFSVFFPTICHFLNLHNTIECTPIIIKVQSQKYFIHLHVGSLQWSKHIITTNTNPYTALYVSHSVLWVELIHQKYFRASVSNQTLNALFNWNQINWARCLCYLLSHIQEYGTKQ